MRSVVLYFKISDSQVRELAGFPYLVESGENLDNAIFVIR